MKQMLLSEIHDAKIKLVKAINSNDTEMIKKYEEVILELEKSLKLIQE